MGVRATLVGITLTTQDITQAESIGADVKGLFSLAELKCQELETLLNFIVNDILTPAGDTANASTFSTEVTALS